MIFCAILVKVFAQSDYDNHRKYWYYKTRLNNDFLKVGLNAGESIPAGKRGDTRPEFINPTYVNTVIDWGDATSELGYYIAVLATEYKLLAFNNQNTDKVKHELFCALNAVNRLDYVGETFFNGSPNLNGYFVRDDVPANFVSQNYKHFNYFDKGGNATVPNNQNSRGFMSKFDNGANGGDGWIVKSLTKDELNLTCQRDGGYNLKIRKSYLLVLSKNKYQVVPILH